MSSVNETSAAHIHIVILLLLQDGHLPGILPELCVALLVTLGGVVDPPVDPVGVPLAALAVLAEGLAAGGQAVQGLTKLLRLMSHVPVERKYLVKHTTSNDQSMTMQDDPFLTLIPDCVQTLDLPEAHVEAGASAGDAATHVT